MKRFCTECYKSVETVIRKVEEDILVKGMSIHITSEIAFCAECGSEIFDATLDSENLSHAYTEYRRLNGLLQPQEIRDIRKKYDISAQDFAKILGLGGKTITRYENGAIQDEALNNLMYLVSDSQTFRRLWDKRKSLLSKKTRDKIERTLTNYSQSYVQPFLGENHKIIYMYHQSAHGYKFNEQYLNSRYCSINSEKQRKGVS